MRISKLILSFILVVCLHIPTSVGICKAYSPSPNITIALPNKVIIEFSNFEPSTDYMLVVKGELNGEINYLKMVNADKSLYTFSLSERFKLNDNLVVSLGDLVEYTKDFIISEVYVCQQLSDADFETFNLILDEFKDGIGETIVNNYNNLSTEKKIKVYQRLQNNEYNTLAGFSTLFGTTIQAVITESEPIVNVSKNPGGSGGSGGGGSKNITAVIPAPSPEPQIIESIKPDYYYSDVSQVTWAVESINELTKSKVLSGSGDGKFLPMDNVTRAEFVKMLVGAFAVETDGKACPFYDVKHNSWQYPYVAAAYQLGLAKGKAEFNFEPDSFITRQDAVTMLYRFCEYNKIKLTGKAEFIKYSDGDKIAPYAVDAVSFMSMSSVISGVEGNRFAPEDNCTRAMAAKMIFSAIKLK